MLGRSERRAPGRRRAVSGRKNASSSCKRECRQQELEHQARRRGRELHQYAGSKPAHTESDHGSDAVDQGSAFAVQVDEAGAERAGRNARCYALENACRQQPPHGVRVPEEQHGDDLQNQRPEHHLAAAAIVGQRSEHQQGKQERQRVAAEHDGQRQRGEAPTRAVHGVERRRHAGGGQEGQQDQPLEPERLGRTEPEV